MGEKRWIVVEETDEGKSVLFKGCHYSYEKQDPYYSYKDRRGAMQARRNYMRTETDYGYSLEGRTFYVEECNPYVIPAREFTFPKREDYNDVSSYDISICPTVHYSIKEPVYERLLDIAKGCSPEVFDRGDLEQRGSDREDFVEMSVWSVQELLVKAYIYGNKGLF